MTVPTLRQQLTDTSRPAVIPGGGTPLEALATQAAGFGGFYLSGYAVAAWRHGLPDIGLLGATDQLDALRAVRRVVPELPVIVDLDTGYGDETSVWANVRLLEEAGASALQIEDQVWPKRCGHMAGKEVIDADTAVRKIASAAAARRNPETVIIARTDSLAPRGPDEALARCRRFADAGADVLFIDAPDHEQLRRIGTELPGPLMANMSEGGLTPLLSAGEFHALGFQLVIYPTTTLRIASHQMSGFLADLRRSGDSAPWRPRMDGLDELNALVGLDEYLTIGDRVSAPSGS
ncbi:isocitrate lyase/PEP mutase family protein [Pseudolysinimonas sp.]|uniref:isocitrate lyase/PEP mutase family protein n=1 Tax=Pseudolysinimonas sp. TaxID=2680009 RepID=UPI003F808541